MTTLILNDGHNDGFTPYFERTEQRLRAETVSQPPEMAPDRHRPMPLAAVDPRLISASGPKWPPKAA